MNFLYYKVDAGPQDTILVNMNGRANVRLLDSLNYYKYKIGKKYEESGGGEALDSPVHLKAPYKAKWHVVVDLGKAGGEVRATVDVVKG
jgi:hypothetical protein